MESYRTRQKLTYRQLIERLHLDGMPVSVARRIALGIMWPRPRVIERIVAASENEITVQGMFERYAARQEKQPVAA